MKNTDINKVHHFKTNNLFQDLPTRVISSLMTANHKSYHVSTEIALNY